MLAPTGDLRHANLALARKSPGGRSGLSGFDSFFFEIGSNGTAFSSLWLGSPCKHGLFASLTLRAARNYVRYSATLRSYSGHSVQLLPVPPIF